MLAFEWRLRWPVRAIGPATALLLLAAAPGGAAIDDHAEAEAALGDVRAALGAIVAADASYSTDRNLYHAAAQRAADLLAGDHDSGAAGAIAHIDRLLDRVETPLWAAALEGAEANLRAAAATLRAAAGARELMGFQTLASQAMASIALAEGRASETGVLGGLEGALANTTLGVPAGAVSVDACTPPTAPGWGVHDGALAWIAVPASQGSHALVAPFGGRTLAVQGNLLVLRTAAAATVAAACPRQHAGSPARLPAEPALYTRDQALAGLGVFMAHCAACHGTDLGGVSAPAVAGTDFLATAKRNGWTLEIVRTLVFTMMPLDAAGTLPAEQYAQVMAYLLAANCYPAGNAPFPAGDKPQFAKVRLAPPTDPHPQKDAAGRCPVD